MTILKVGASVVGGDENISMEAVTGVVLIVVVSELVVAVAGDATGAAVVDDGCI